MWIFSEVADWVDERARQSDAMLDKWVEDSKYGQGVMITAATTHSFMKFGASMTDVLRLGDGVRKGGWGWGEDAFLQESPIWRRLLAFPWPSSEGSVSRTWEAPCARSARRPVR